MRSVYIKKTDEKGMIAIIALLGVMAVTLAIVTSISALSVGELKMSRSGGSLDRTFYAAEAGLNEALYRLIENPAPGNRTFHIDDISVAVTAQVDPSDAYRRIIESKATDPNGNVRTVRIIANTSSFAPAFDYAIQGGQGGVYVDNNSLIIGNIYSNGNILPASAGAKGNVHGQVWVANNYLIDNVTVTGDVHAHSIKRSTIAGSAYYQSVDASTKVHGTQCPNTYCHPGSPDTAPKPFPIDDDDIQKWKDDIMGLGNPVLAENPAACPVSYNTGFYCVTSNAVLGNQKIEANFYVGNGATLTLTGNLWITGKIIFDNNGTISIDPSLGPKSVTMISDGTVDINNNYTINGSGHPGSFILIVSMSPSVDLSSPAIYASNNSQSIIFAALHGMLKVKNNGELNAAVADTLYLEPNSTVTYNPFLVSFNIPSGGSEAIGTAFGTWEEK